MDRRDFLKMSSVTAMMAAGEWTGLSKVFAQSSSGQKESSLLDKGKANENPTSAQMECRNLGGMDVSAIGLGCLPMIDENSRFKPGDRRYTLPQFTPEALKPQYAVGIFGGEMG